MTFIKKQNAGLLKSARSWGALGLLLALVVTVGVGSGQSQTNCVTPPPGMVAWWPLDGLNANGEYDDLAGGDNNGTPINAPTPILGQYVGNSIQAGINKYVEVADDPALNFGQGNFTIDAWIKFTPGTQTEPIVHKLDASGGYFLYIERPTSGPATLRLRIANQVFVGQTIAAATGTWIFVAATRVGSVVTLYLDNQAPVVASTTPVPNATSSSPLWIGHWTGNPHASLGIDEVEIFNRPLDQSEIQAIFKAGPAGKCKNGGGTSSCVPAPKGLDHWWPFDETAHPTIPTTIAHDIVAGRDGTTQVGALDTAGSPKSVAGKVTNAFEFDGSSVLVEVQDGPGTLSYGNPGQDFSIDAWIKVDPNDKSGVRPIVDKRFDFPDVQNPNVHTRGYQFFLFNGQLGFQLADDMVPGPGGLNQICDAGPPFTANCTNYVSAANVATGTWQHVTVTVGRSSGSSGNVTLYVGGAPVPVLTRGARKGNANNGIPLLIGKGYPIVISAPYFKGIIDELEIFNRELQQLEIEAIFKADSAGKCKAQICVAKFHDLNGDGVWQAPPEPPLYGWEFNITGSQINNVGPVKTDKEKEACWIVPAPGTYAVTETVQSGWTNTTPNPQSVPVQPGQKVEVNFGNKEKKEEPKDFCPIDLKLNENLSTGVDNAAALIAPGSLDDDWEITVDGSGGLVPRQATVVTTTGVPSGVWPAPLPGSQWITAVAIGANPAQPPPPPTKYVYQRCFCLNKGSDNVKLSLTLRADDKATVLLNGNTLGSYTFPGAPLTISETDLKKFKDGINCLTIQVEDTQRVITGLNVSATVTADKGFCCNAIMGRKWNDLDGDGVKDPGEPWLQNWTINANPGNLTEVTDANGYYVFLGLTSPGTYTVAETTLPNWTQTFPGGSGTHAVTFPFAPNGFATGRDFGNRQKEGKAEICIFKFEDLDGDGQKDPNEPLIAWTFNVNPGPPTQVTTQAGGGFCFGVSAPSTHTITEVIPPPPPVWTPTTPTSQTVTVQPNQPVVNLFFGNRKREEGKCDLTIRKTVDPNPPVMGQPFAFAVTVTNVGTAPCPPTTTVTDNLPIGFVVTLFNPNTAGGWVCSSGPPNIVCNNSTLTLQPGQSSTVFAVVGTFTLGAGIENCAELKNPNDSNSDNNRACVKVTFVQPPGKCDLAIRKSVSPNPVNSGQQATVTITVTNVGTAPCPGPTTVTETVPAGLTLISAGGPGWTCVGPVCTYPLPIPVNGSVSVTYTFNVTAPPGTAIQNCATVNNPNDPLNPANPGNNQSCVTINVTGGVCDLKITKTVSPNPVASGGTVTVTLTVQNVGTGPCGPMPGGILVADPNTPGLVFTVPPVPDQPVWTCGFTGPGSGVFCSAPGLIMPQGYLVTFTINNVNVTAPAGSTIQNCAEVTNVGEGPATQANNKSCVTIQVSGPLCRDVTINLSTGVAPWTVNPGTVGVITNLGPLSGTWVAPTAPARWIQPANSPTPQLLPGGVFYQYSVPFTLPGPLSQYSTISLTGRYAADNTVHAFFVGPASAGPGGPLCQPANANCFSAWTPFSITAATAFMAGPNNLSVRVYNNPTGAGGPTYTGLAVEATLQAVCRR